MRASINIQLDEIGPEELHRFLAALQGSAATAKVSGIVEGAKVAPDKAVPEQVATQTGDEPLSQMDDPEPAAPPKAKRGRPRKTAPAGDDVDATTGPTAGDDTDGGEADAAPAPAPAAPNVTENAVKQAIAAAIKAKGIDGVRTIVASFKNAQGGPAAKLSDLQAQDYGAVVAALEAPSAE